MAPTLPRDMVSFASERLVRRTRRVHVCDCCHRRIELHGPMATWSGSVDGDFSHATMHVDCRTAEVRLNDLHGTVQDEWERLDEVGPEDHAWLLDEFPDVAGRLGIGVPA